MCLSHKIEGQGEAKSRALCGSWGDRCHPLTLNLNYPLSPGHIGEQNPGALRAQFGFRVQEPVQIHVADGRAREGLGGNWDSRHHRQSNRPRQQLKQKSLSGSREPFSVCIGRLSPNVPARSGSRELGPHASENLAFDAPQPSMCNFQGK